MSFNMIGQIPKLWMPSSEYQCSNKNPSEPQSNGFRNVEDTDARPSRSSENEYPHGTFSQSNQAIELNHSYLNVRFQAVRRPLASLSIRSPVKPRTKTKKSSTSFNVDHNADFRIEQARNWINKCARSILMRSRYFSINELYKQDEQKNNFEQELKVMKVKTEYEVNLLTINKHIFHTMCKLDKYQSSSIQSAIKNCTQAEVGRTSALVSEFFEDLLVDKYGNYILQQALISFPNLRIPVEYYCCQHLDDLITNEYASRVMQCLNQVSPSFRNIVFSYFFENLQAFIVILPSVFLLTSAIYYSETSAELAKAKGLIFCKSSRKLLHYKYFKRVVMAFVEKAEPMELDLVWNIYKLSGKLMTHLDDKFGALLVSALISRGHQQTILLFIKLLNENLISLYEAKYFKFLFYRLVSAKGREPMKRQMLIALLTMDSCRLSQAIRCNSSCVFFGYMVSNLLPEDQKVILTNLSNVFDQPDDLRDFLLSLPYELRLRYD